MDIKLKNRRKLGICLMLLVVTCVASAMLALYPFFADQVQSFGATMENPLFDIAHIYSYDDGYFFQISNMIYMAMTALLVVTALAALILPCFRTLGIQEFRIFKVCFEPVTAVIILLICGMWGMADVVIASVDMSFMESLLELGLDLQEAGAVITVLNSAAWILIFGVFYWAVTCYRAFFSMGIIRYIKERTWISRFFQWCKRIIWNCYRMIEKIDLKEASNKTLFKIVLGNFILLTIICCFWFFGIGALMIYSVVLFFILRKCYTDIHEKYKVLLRATNQIADGHLDVEIREDLGVFEPFKEEIQKIQSGFKKAVDEEVKSQSMRTELITNVSHDLKTPLTAIITYVDLLKNDKITDEERTSYIQVLDQKSMRLKALIEDLFEISKVNSRNVTLNLVQVDIVNLLKQVRLELDDKIMETSLDFRFTYPSEKVMLYLDSDKTYRVFENLLVNILKYAMPGTRVYVDMAVEDGQVVVTMKNVSANEIHVDSELLTERFVRGDVSRNTEGSGLGLAIAKSFVELQNGKFQVETEADLFKVRITWPFCPIQDRSTMAGDEK